MEERKILSYTLGKEAGEKSIIRIYSDGQQIQYFGFTNDGEAYEKTFAIPLDGLKRFRRSLQPWLVRNGEVDLENPNNYHWTLNLIWMALDPPQWGRSLPRMIFKSSKRIFFSFWSSWKKNTWREAEYSFFFCSQKKRG